MKAQILIIIIFILALISISITSTRVLKYLYNIHKIINKQYNTIGTVPKSNKKIVNTKQD